MNRVTHVTLKGEVGSYTEGDTFIEAPGDVVLVKRVFIRAMLISCPDGCGEVLTINLNPAVDGLVASFAQEGP